MKRVLPLLASVAALVALSSVPASAYYYFTYFVPTGKAPAKFDVAALPNKTVWFFVSESGPTSFGANDNFASVIGQIRQAAQAWNSVSSSDLRVGFGGFENPQTQQNTPAADVVFEDLPPGLLGYGGPTMLATPVIPAAETSANPWVPITRAAIHLNLNQTIAPGPSYSESFYMTVVHEMGHALGLQHTFTSSTMSTATTRSTSLMNPLEADDIAGISVLYPNESLAKTGSIGGRITTSGNGVHMESVVAIRAGSGAISAFTNPDGTFQIDGVPPGQYFIYAHALPPDADVKGPWYADSGHPNGTVIPASGPTNALFYPGTTDIEAAVPVTVKAGTVTDDVNIEVAGMAALPVYDVSVYGYYNNNTIAVKPAYLNRLAKNAVVAAAGVGLGSNGQAPGLDAAFMGDSAIIQSGGVRPYQAGGYTYLALDVGYFLFGVAGPQHLIVSTPGFMHVLPSAVRLTEQNPPAIQSVSANGDGTLTLTGTNWMPGSSVYFDGLPATIKSLKAGTASITAEAGLSAGAISTAVVTPPAGTNAQVAILTLYNPDGQSSQFLQVANPATFTYGTAPTQTIVSISPASLPAGAEGMVEITGSGFNFVSGQTAVGFGTSDIVVRQVFVLGPNHLLADVSVAQGAVLSSPDVSVFSGFQMATAPAGFHISAAVKGLPATVPLLTNALPGLTGAYAGATVSLYGSNLAVPNTATVVTFNGEAANILFSSPTQVNLQIPADIAAGPAQLKVFNGALNSYVVAVNIDTPPASVTSIQDTNGNPIGASSPGKPGDLLSVNLSGFAPDGTEIDPAQVTVGVNGLSHKTLSISQPATGIWQVNFLLKPDEPAGTAQSLIVYFNGRSSYPATIPINASSALSAALRN